MGGNKMRIGIIGGSFNPPHKLHYQMGIEVLKHNLVDKVIYLPTGDKYGKEGLIAGSHRLKMLEVMIKDPNIEVSDYEIVKGASYTYETLDYFKGLYPNDELYFIMSTDLILDIDKWKNPEHILANYKILGLKRAGIDDTKLPGIYNKYPGSLILYDFAMGELSSTMIREEMKEKGYDNLDKYLDTEVIDYIIYNDLYK
jgi:nicotinate-nucleotide adenylyltransferase